MNFITQENKELLLSRAKSLGWRVGGMAGAAVLAFLSENLNLLVLPPLVQVLLGLVIGEITKLVQKKVQLGKAKK